MAYRAPKQRARFEQEIKKSRFIALALPATTPEEVAAALAGIAREFPGATHVAWAYLLGNPDDGPRMRADDAGEPAGTAGKPILNVLQHRGVGDLLVAVVRYFGGVKLGAGGLVRAYSSTASGAMDRLELRTVTPRVEIRLRVEYSDEQSARRLFGERGVEILSTVFGDAVVLIVRAPVDQIASLAEELAERTRGRAAIVGQEGCDIVSVRSRSNEDVPAMTTEAEPRYLYCWFDTEYTTLELERAKLLEVALVVTDDDLCPLRGDSEEIPAELLRQDGFSAFVTPPPMREMSEHVKQNYQPLLARCRKEGRSAAEVDRYLVSYMDSFPECRAESVRDRPVLAGNSVYADYFLARKFLPGFLSRLNYRLFDVSTFKLEWLFHYRGKKFQKLGSLETIRKYYKGRDPVVGDKHDAYYDVQASIAELAFYRSRMTKK